MFQARVHRGGGFDARAEEEETDMWSNEKKQAFQIICAPARRPFHKFVGKKG